MCRAPFWATSDSYPCCWVDSTPRMGEWVGAWDGAIWDDFSSWTCPFPLDLFRCLLWGDFHHPDLAQIASLRPPWHQSGD